jgi:hypothetical protein
VRFFVLLTFILFSSSVFSNSSNESEYYKVRFKFQEGDRITSILKGMLKDSDSLSSKSPTIVMTKKKNPQIKSWRRLKDGQGLIIYVYKKEADVRKIKAYLKSRRRKSGFDGSIFFMTSIGLFNQKLPRLDVNIDFNQNSPYTFGVMGNYSFDRKRYSVSTSAYLSSLSSNKSNYGEIDIPDEIGLNLYFQKNNIGNSMSAYGGFDYETFSIFNSEIFSLDNRVEINTVTVAYLTLGISKLFNLSGTKIFTKFSASKSISSNVGKRDASTPIKKDYDGFKIMSYWNYKFHKHWFAHILLKYHSFSGDDEISFMRGGAGVGYSF